MEVLRDPSFSDSSWTFCQFGSIDSRNLVVVKDSYGSDTTGSKCPSRKGLGWLSPIRKRPGLKRSGSKRTRPLRSGTSFLRVGMSQIEVFILIYKRRRIIGVLFSVSRTPEVQESATLPPVLVFSFTTFLGPRSVLGTPLFILPLRLSHEVPG